MKTAAVIAGLVLLLGFATNVHSSPAQTAPTSKTVAPKVTVGGNLKAKAASPTPPATSQSQSQESAIGKGKVAVEASGPSSFWAEEIDVDDDGVVESNQFLFDAMRNVLYTYREDDFGCANGGTATGSVLEAFYAKGNATGKPVGSGWYIVSLNAGQCGAKREGVYGCKFDAAGNPTECGAATVNNKTGEIDVAVVK